MKIASNTHRGAYLEESPSIRAALELLSDKEPVEQQGTLIDVESERKAREEEARMAEAERKKAEAGRASGTRPGSCRPVEAITAT